MDDCRSLPRRITWRVPVFLSLLAHAALAILFWLATGRQGAERDRPMQIDTLVHERELDVMVMAIEESLAGSHGSGAAVKPLPVVPTLTAAPHSPPVQTAPSVPNTASAASPSSGTGDGASAGAGAAATTFFDVPAQGRSVIYVIDRSGSMGAGGRLDLARREVLASLQKLAPEVRFQVIAYNRFAEPLRIAGHSDLLAATPENKQQTAAVLAGLLPEGGTEHLQALKQALLLQPEVIYFLTDADDLHPDQVRALTRLNHGRTAIHTIELTGVNRDRADMPLHVLARENGGKYRAVEVGR